MNDTAIAAPPEVKLKSLAEILSRDRKLIIIILGEVQSPTSHVYEPGLTRDDYIQRSGGTGDRLYFDPRILMTSTSPRSSFPG